MSESKTAQYWQDLKELDSSEGVLEESRDEFSQVPDLTSLALKRRSFLQVMGFSLGAATLAGCSAPVQKAIPFLNKPVEMTPGVPNWYASTCGGCNAKCGILVKVRDGRPIKIEGNPEHVLNQGGLCAAGQAAIFNLYSSDRLQGPLVGGRSVTWEELDQQINNQLATIRSSGGNVRLLTPTVSSPTTQSVIQQFLEHFPGSRWIIYDPISYSAILEAHQRSHGRSVLPSFHFEKAMTVVSFDADFLATWISPVGFARDYVHLRKLVTGQHPMSRHYHFEPQLSLTGSNADHRFRLAPFEQGPALIALARSLAAKAGSSTNELSKALGRVSPADGYPFNPEIQEAILTAGNDLWEHRGASLVICGSNDVATQTVANAINQALGNYGTTIDLTASSLQYQGSDYDMAALVEEMEAGQVAALIIAESNPAYNYPRADQFQAGLQKVSLTVAMNQFPDESASQVRYLAPPHHFLESWNDAQPIRGVISLSQPTIHPIFSTRPIVESLLQWVGVDAKAYDLIQEHWKSHIYPLSSSNGTFQDFWDESLRNGIRTIALRPEVPPSYQPRELEKSLEKLASPRALSSDQLALVVYESINFRDGEGASNPWLQELPNPITKISWDNYLSLSPHVAAQLQLQEGDIVRVATSGHSFELPVQIQPGQHDRVASVALGYGRRKAGKLGSQVGANAFPLLNFFEGTFHRDRSWVSLQKTGRSMAFAMTQTHSSMEGRPIVREMALSDYLKKHPPGEELEEPTIWREHPYTGHKWAMAIDLNACIGCSACVLGCQVENNVPVVGKDEVRRRREMHWIRIDRYYRGDAAAPETVYQPMMCSQCDNAACESVCPALATVHSTEGLNMQVYNRCVGTRYCANNCPFKVRRFNWFDYPHNDALENLALNPDVTVRTRGVMEKCTFCVQRIEAAKIQARNEGRFVKDGEIQTACQQSCPTQAIVFGDLNDPQSEITRLQKDSRKYHLLDEINLKTNIAYLTKVRNPKSGGSE